MERNQSDGEMGTFFRDRHDDQSDVSIRKEGDVQWDDWHSKSDEDVHARIDHWPFDCEIIRSVQHNSRFQEEEIQHKQHLQMQHKLSNPRQKQYPKLLPAELFEIEASGYPCVKRGDDAYANDDSLFSMLKPSSRIRIETKKHKGFDFFKVLFN